MLIDTASGHVHGAAGSETPRNDDHMEVRLDARTSSEKETRALGINIGDCVAFDPRVEVTNGFIRSRFLDDKACVANLVAAIKSMAESAPGSSAERVLPHIELWNSNAPLGLSTLKVNGSRARRQEVTA